MSAALYFVLRLHLKPLAKAKAQRSDHLYQTLWAVNCSKSCQCFAVAALAAGEAGEAILAVRFWFRVYEEGNKVPPALGVE